MQRSAGPPLEGVEQHTLPEREIGIPETGLTEHLHDLLEDHAATHDDVKATGVEAGDAGPIGRVGDGGQRVQRTLHFSEGHGDPVQ